MSDRDCENCKHHTEKGCDSWDCNFERKVTRKETIKAFEDMKKGLYPFDLTDYLDIAINSLEIDERYELEYEQIEPCEDAISRQAVLEIQAKYAEHIGATKFWQMRDDIKALPSVAPQPKTGRWIAQNIYNCHTAFKCSECGYIHDFMHLYGEPTADYTYCPKCGAKMQEVSE